MLPFLFHARNQASSISIGVSACLLGYPVRYDGKTKSLPQLFDEPSIPTQWYPACPEITLGVPRPPVQLIKTNSDASIQARGVNDKQLDVTAELVNNGRHILHSEGQSPYSSHLDSNDNLGSEERIKALVDTANGFCQAQDNALKERVDIWLLKARSPSCGSQSTPLYDEMGKELAKTDGIFAGLCRAETPLCAIFDEGILNEIKGKELFYLSALITQDIKQASNSTMPELIKHYKAQKLLPAEFNQIDPITVCMTLHNKIKHYKKRQLESLLSNIISCSFA